MRLQGRVAVVTAPPAGSGWPSPGGFVAEGARVVLADWLADEARIQAEALGAAALAVATDVGDSGQGRRLVATTVERCGRLDCIVANAAVQAEIPFPEPPTSRLVFAGRTARRTNEDDGAWPSWPSPKGGG